MSICFDLQYQNIVTFLWLFKKQNVSYDAVRDAVTINLNLGMRHNKYCCYLQVVIGNREWMLRNGVELHMDTERKMSEEEECGHTAVLVAIDGMYGWGSWRSP